MSTTSIDGLREYVLGIQRRRTRLLILREISLGIVLLTVLFTALGILEMLFRFSPVARIVLAVILAAAAGALVWRCIHIYRQVARDDRRIAHYVDENLPELEQRLITSMEFVEHEPSGGTSELVKSLWDDTLVRVGDLDPTRVSTLRTAWVATAVALIVIGGLFYVVRNVDDFSLAGLRIIMPWTQANDAAVPAVGLSVEPGTIKIQRGNDVMLIARIKNAVPDGVNVYLQTDSVTWRQAAMTQEGGQNSFVYFLTAVQTDVAYYVDIGVKRSKQHRISVFDMPRVEQIDVAYEYPEYMGLKNKTVKNGGDIIAPEGTRITLHAAFNKAVARAAVHFSDGTTLELKGDNTGQQTAKGSFIITKDLTYTINVIDTAQMKNEDPYEYFVRSVPDAPPTVTLVRPGRDRRVMSLEEVSIAAAAEDDHGLADFVLNYTVADGDPQKIDFQVAPDARSDVSIEGRATLYLEDLDVEPGDFVFYHLSARDNNRLKGASETVSDIYFLQVVPTAASFRRASRQAGGGGGSGGGRRSASALVENQKNIIAATWKLLRQQNKISPKQFEENITTINDSQRQVMQRTRLSLQRLSERLSFSDDSYQRAVEHLKRAVTRMEAAIEKLGAGQLAQALGPEQSALREIMKAEAESRNTMIQMARNRGGGGVGDVQSRERQDLKELFAMEMGRLENRYEMPKQTAGTRQGRKQDDALEKLRDLARRQERLNRRQDDLARRQDRLTAEQKKRHLEELRREQEELRRETRELSRQASRLARRKGLRQSSDHRQRLEDAARQMQEAERNLRRQDTGGALARGRQVLEDLREQEKEMRLDRQATISSLIDALNRKAQTLQRQEQQILRNLQAIQNQDDSETSPADSQSLERIKTVLADKEKMQAELTDAETMLKTIAGKGRSAQPDVADRAGEALQALKTDRIKERIEESQQMLEAGWLGLSMDAEKKIERSVERVSRQLRNLDRPAAPSRDEKIRQAAADAAGLRQALERLQKEIEAQNQNNARQQQSLSGRDLLPKGLSQQQPADGNGSAQERMQQHLQRSRRFARGLVQPWARGERWGVDARSIQRELSRKEIEDFLAQPDLWQKLLVPVRELESALRAETEGRQLKKKVFSMPEESVPTPYRDKVEEYYRELSRVEKANSRR